jgi:hypothetical protein
MHTLDYILKDLTVKNILPSILKHAELCMFQQLHTHKPEKKLSFASIQLFILKPGDNSGIHFNNNRVALLKCHKLAHKIFPEIRNAVFQY